MNTDKEQWINEVFNSLEGIQPAQPDVKMFSKIENELFNPEARVIPLYWIKTAAAAAVLVLSVNIYGILQYANSDTQSTEQDAQQNSYELIRSYNLYE